MYSIPFKKDSLSLIRNLSNINPKLIFEKEEGRLHIDSRNVENTVAFDLNLPLEDFNFDGDELGFIDFKEFYTFLSTVDNAEIIQNEDKLELKSDRSKITYYWDDPDVIDKEYDYIEFNDTEAKFNLSMSDIKKIKSYIVLLRSENVSFTVKDNKMLLKLFADAKQPMFEDEFDLTEWNKEEFSLEAPSDIFIKAPENEYDVHLHSDGIVKFEYINDRDIQLNIFTALHED